MGRGLRLSLGLVGVVAMLGVLVAPSAGSVAGAGIPVGFTPRAGNVGGLVPVLGSVPSPFWDDFCPGVSGCGGGDLAYHGGSVMRTNTTYAIFWLPSGYHFGASDSGYENAIDRFLMDVGADSGADTNVFSVGSQYYDTVGGGRNHVAYDSSFGGSYVATNAFPANGCNDPYTSVCLIDFQLQTEIQSVVNLKGWPRDGSSLYLIFTPQDVGGCINGACVYTDYCAYHGSFVTTGATEILYANLPWAAAGPSSPNCDAGEHPNASEADPTINIASHEFNEAVTDPNVNEPDGSHLSAWWDDQGYEIGDKCAWTFGTLSGSSGAAYNQTINGHHYLMQEEYSNVSHVCLQNTEAPPPPPRLSGLSAKSGPVGVSLTLSGSNLTEATGVSFNGTPATTFDVVADNTITVTVPVGAKGGRVGVTTPGGTATSKQKFKVETPSAKKLSPPKGPVGTVVKIRGAGLAAATGVSFNGTPAATVTVQSDKEVDATVPTGATSGTVTVTNPGGMATGKKPFTVTP